jgi:hypothetical protein
MTKLLPQNEPLKLNMENCVRNIVRRQCELLPELARPCAGLGKSRSVDANKTDLYNRREAQNLRESMSNVTQIHRENEDLRQTCEKLARHAGVDPRALPALRPTAGGPSLTTPLGQMNVSLVYLMYSQLFPFLVPLP